MNTVLWIVQVLWGVFFSVTGFGKVSCYNPVLWNQALHEVPWLSAVPQDLFIFIGVCEFLGGVGLLLPMMTGFKPNSSLRVSTMRGQPVCSNSIASRGASYSNPSR